MTDRPPSAPAVRAGQAEDCGELARLVMMSDSSFLPFLFGDRLETALQQMLARPRNLFSFEHTRVIEVNGQVAGVLLGYSYEQMRSEALPTGLLWLRSLGFSLLRRLPELLRVGFASARTAPARKTRDSSGNSRWLSPAEFYVSNMAVKPEFRRIGLGRRLLVDAIARARELGCRQVALDVDARSAAAIALYTSLGFVREEHDLKVMGRFEFRRMSRGTLDLRLERT